MIEQPLKDDIQRSESLGSAGKMNTRIAYLYRDAANYKTWGEEVIEGTLTLEQLTPYLIDGEFFIPEDVGMPCLQPDPGTEDDHDLHTIEELTETADSPTIAINSQMLQKAFIEAGKEKWSDY
jgi:hypothetical protein